jgi:hypothetical protein
MPARRQLMMVVSYPGWLLVALVGRRYGVGTFDTRDKAEQHEDAVARRRVASF